MHRASAPSSHCLTPARYKEEQAQRLLLESECGQLRAGKEALEGQLEAQQEEKAQLLDLVNSQRNNSSRLEVGRHCCGVGIG